MAELPASVVFHKTVVTRQVAAQNGVVFSRKSIILASPEFVFVGNTVRTSQKVSQNVVEICHFRQF